MHDRLLENWNAVDAITLQFLDNIPESIYHSRPFAGRFTTFAWEFTCIFTTREMYIDGFVTGNLDGNSKQSDEKFITALTKSELKEKLKDISFKIRDVIADRSKEINYFGCLSFSTKNIINYFKLESFIPYISFLTMFNLLRDLNMSLIEKYLPFTNLLL